MPSATKNLAPPSMFDNCNEAILCCSPQGEVIYFNSSYSSFIKKNFNSDIQDGVIIYDLLPSKYRSGLRKLHNKTLKGEHLVVNFFHTTENGKPVFFEISLSPIETNGKIDGLLEISRDISKKKLADKNGDRVIIENETYYLDSNVVLAKEISERTLIEERLKENEERLSQIIHSNSIPTFVIDKSHVITHWNKACEILTGLRSSEMIGTDDQWKPFYLKKRPTMADLVVEQSDQEIFKRHYGKKYRKSLLIEDAVEAEDFFDFREVGKWLFFTAAPLKNTAGDIIGAVETLQDITDRKRMEEEIYDSHQILEERIEERTEQLKITYDQLLHAEKLSAVGKLAASIAHEFGNPIIGIRNFLKGLSKSSMIESTDVEVIELAISECQRVKDLISNLQDFNRPTSGTMEPMDLHQAINDMLLFCKKDLKEKQIKVTKCYSADLPKIEAISDQIKQVILNCLNNAAEAIKEFGSISIKTEAVDGQVLVHISDTGKGIQESDINYIFEPFFSTKPAVEGTGLGLSVSYGIIKRHSGEIEVTDTSDKGSTFTISLPIT